MPFRSVRRWSILGAQQQGANATTGRWLVIPRTLCFILNGDDVLLMKRSPHRRVFPNQYNGVGGHIERDEDPFSGAIREIREETGLSVHDVRLRAVYNIDARQATGILLFVFTAHSDSRTTIADEREGTLHWVPRGEVMKLDLVEDIPISCRVCWRWVFQTHLYLCMSVMMRMT
ncbi:NUDIX domain-containing protein [bacterium]|nr:NUDIX domain-containing protein [bacterium]